MSATYRITILYRPEPIPEAPDFEELMGKVVEEEIVEVQANSMEAAVRRAMLFASIDPRGRLVHYFDEHGAELSGSYSPKPDPDLE